MADPRVRAVIAAGTLTIGGLFGYAIVADSSAGSLVITNISPLTEVEPAIIEAPTSSSTIAATTSTVASTTTSSTTTTVASTTTSSTTTSTTLAPTSTSTTTTTVAPTTVAPPTTAAPASCDPNYSGGCVPIASDVDCAGGSGNGPAYVRGPVTVVGSDIYGLDGDNDGIGCE